MKMWMMMKMFITLMIIIKKSMMMMGGDHKQELVVGYRESQISIVINRGHELHREISA